MRLLTLCAVFSVLLAVSLANPVKTQIHDESNSSESKEDSELKNIDKNSSSSEEEQVKENKNIIRDNNGDESSADTSETLLEEKAIVTDETTQNSSSEEEENEQPKEHHLILVVDDNEILDITKSKTKRSYAVDNASNSHNQLKVKDEGSIKYEKYLKLKRLRRDLESNKPEGSHDISPRFARSPSTSEENSSEEGKKGKNHDARFTRSAETSEENSSEENKKGAAHLQKSSSGHEHSAAPAEKPAAGPAETGHEHSEAPAEHAAAADAGPAETGHEHSEAPAEQSAAATGPEHSGAHADPAIAEPKPEETHIKTEASRRRRSLDEFSEEDKSEPLQEMNEVFIFSNENHQESAENLKSVELKNNEYAVVKDNDLEKSLEKKNSDEDYAQGCGGNNINQSEDLNENSNEDNETFNQETDKL